jgi:thiamine biosynthesis lipoprotein
MGLQVRIVLYVPDEESARLAASAAYAEIARLDAVFSDYRYDSELMRLMARAGGPPVRVSEELFLVLERALEMSRQTAGAFDITAGPLTTIWREATREARLPSHADLQKAAMLTGHEKMRLDSGEGAVELLVPGMRLDLGAIAKGYILDRALATLGDCGAGIALIEAGGDIVVGDPPPGREGWQIRIAHALACEVSLAHAAVSTSGDTTQFIEVHGTRYSHVVDPRTGYGLTHRRMATVVAADGITADSLATSLTLMDGADSAELLIHYPEARAVVRGFSGEDGGMESADPSASCRTLQGARTPPVH